MIPVFNLHLKNQLHLKLSKTKHKIEYYKNISNHSLKTRARVCMKKGKQGKQVKEVTATGDTVQQHYIQNCKVSKVSKISKYFLKTTNAWRTVKSFPTVR